MWPRGPLPGQLLPLPLPLLGGSWVVISGVISPLIWVITIGSLLITPLIANHEPPSSRRGWFKQCGGKGFRQSASGTFGNP